MFQVHQPQLISPSPSCSIVFGLLFFCFFLVLLFGLGTYLSFRFLSFFLCCQPRQPNPRFGQFSFFMIITRYVITFIIVVFYWIPRDSKSPQVSRTFNILTDLNNAVVWMVSIFLLISKYSKLFQILWRPFLQLVWPSPPWSTVFFFSSLARSKYIFLRFGILVRI